MGKRGKSRLRQWFAGVDRVSAAWALLFAIGLHVAVSMHLHDRSHFETPPLADAKLEQIARDGMKSVMEARGPGRARHEAERFLNQALNLPDHQRYQVLKRAQQHSDGSRGRKGAAFVVTFADLDGDGQRDDLVDARLHYVHKSTVWNGGIAVEDMDLYDP
jgi:hypothetical protein